MSLSVEIDLRHKKYKEDHTDIKVIDMHMHFVDFRQNSEGYESLLRSMKRGNISKNIIFGLPVKKKWEFFEPLEPHYYLGDNSRCTYYNATDEVVASGFLKLNKKQKMTIAPTLCGFDPTDMTCIDYIEMMFEKYSIWRGIGELLLRHDDLTNLTQGEVARANHPALNRVYTFCAKKRIPVCLHQNSTCVASSLSNLYKNDYEYLHELTESVERFQDTTFVWAHCGVSRRVQHPKYHEMINGLLSKYHNLHVDLSWEVYDSTICDPGIVARENKYQPKQEWIDLIEEHQDRIMIGSDLCGHFDSHGKTMARYNSLLKKLSDEAAQKVASGNAEKMYFHAFDTIRSPDSP